MKLTRNHLFKGVCKSVTLSTAMNSREDLFSLFRLMAAFLVLYSHSFHIYGLGSDPITSKTGIYTGTFAVYVFFVISGFFIIKSAMERNIIQYLLARVFRIYPALIVCNIVTIVFIIPASLSSDWHSFILSSEVKEYFKINSTLDTINFTISGVFENNPDKAINGFLWTLPVEIRAYFIVILIVMSGMANRKSTFNFLFFIVVFLYLKFPEFYNVIFPIPNSITLLFYFLLGSFLYINRNFIPLSPFFILIALILLIKYRFEWSPLALAILLSYIVISSGYILRYFLNVNIKKRLLIWMLLVCISSLSTVICVLL